MKSKILLALSSLLLPSLFCEKIGAQNFSSVRFEENNDTVLVDIPFNAKNYFVDDDKFLILTPRIQSDHQSLDLLEVILLGEDAKIPDNLNKRNKPYRVFTMNNAQQFVYQVDVSYQPWMDEASLKVEKALYNSDGSRSYEITKTIDSSLKKNGSQQSLPTEYSINIAKASGIDQKHMVIFPRKNSLSISELTRDNFTIDNISNQIDSLYKSGQSSVHMTIIVGTCVAGIYMDNETLTKQQALTLKNYFMEKYKNLPINIDVQWISEDWDGLTNLIKQDNTFPYQQEVLNTINNTGIFTGRERDLMLLAGGDAYRYMKAHYFPKLWKATCTIE